MVVEVCHLVALRRAHVYALRVVSWCLLCAFLQRLTVDTISISLCEASLVVLIVCPLPVQ